MKLTIIESPYAGDVALNTFYALCCMADSLEQGEAPYASHLLYTQPGVLNDQDPVERAKGMAAGFAWGRVAHQAAIYIDLGISNGMLKGIENAQNSDVSLVFRRIEGWESMRAAFEKERGITLQSKEHFDLATAVHINNLVLRETKIKPEAIATIPATEHLTWQCNCGIDDFCTCDRGSNEGTP